MALRSEEAAVRVSAAAVFSKLQDVNRKRIHSAVRELGTHEDPVERAMTLAQASWSRLADETAADAARRDAIETLRSVRPVATVVDKVEEIFCRLLMDDDRASEVEHRVSRLDVASSPTLHDLRMRAQMRIGNHQAIPQSLASRPSDPIRLDRMRHSLENRALLAIPVERGS